MGGNNGSESVATMWRRLIEESQEGPVVISNPAGVDVAVMVGIHHWVEIAAAMVELEQRREGTWEG